MAEPSPIRGLWCASLTPLGPDGAIDGGRFAAHVRGLIVQGVDGVVPFGTSGEGPSFSVGERTAGLDGLLAAGIDPDRIVPATGCAALADTVALTRHALRSGCPRCLIVPPFFWKGLPDEAVFRYYAAIIEAVADSRLRIYLYHIPQVSAVPIPLETVVRLAESYPGVIAGVKDSGADLVHTAALVQRLPQLSILTGYEPHLPELMKIGCAGTICGLANLWPDRIAALLAAVVSPDDVSRIQIVLDIVHRYCFVPGLKILLARQTGDPAWSAVRPPLLPLAEAERESLLAALEQAGFRFPAS